MSFEINTKKVLNKIELENNTNYINQEQLVNNVLDENLNLDFNNSSNTENIYYCEEEDLLNEVQDNFSYQIKERGKDYYYSGNIVSCSKNNNKYYAKVSGTSDKPYIVKVEIKKDGVEYDCTCPYDFPCKHEFAVLMDITNKEYLNIELKPELKEKKDTLQNILKKIPAEEIKKYLLSSKGVNYVCFEMKSFEDYFKKYYPNQTYEYYYNNLFNALVVDVNYENMIDSYINKKVTDVKKIMDENHINTVIIGNGDKIINQYPNKGETVLSYDRVFLITNEGEGKMPNLIGYSRSEAIYLMKTLGYDYELEGYGYVTNQSVKEGDLVGNNVVKITLKEK